MSLMRILILAAMVFCGAVAWADEVTPSSSAPAKIEFQEEDLPNGMHVIYAPLHQAPVVHVRLLYHVGSRDERPDRQGFAHMFEHMMFRGSAHVAPEEHMKRVGVVGGHCNAHTSFDETVYEDTVPGQYLEMALWLEADRMASFKVSDEIYKTERNVVAEEWRMQHNRPYGDVFEQFMKAAYLKHSYRWTPIGNMDHLKAAPVNELQEFFNRYYVPNNATLVVAGDFEVEQAKRFVKQYFEWIPKGPDVKRDITTEPAQSESREVTVNQPVPLHGVLTGYKVPEYESDDHYALNLLSAILGSGDSSRIRRLLVNGKTPMAVEAFSMDEQLEDGGIFGIGAIVMQGKDPKKVREMLAESIADVRKNGVTADELNKAKTQSRIGLIHGRETAEDLGSQLLSEYVYTGDADRVNTAMQKLDAVSIDDIKRVAEKYLKPEQATTLRIEPSLLAMANKAASEKAAQALKDAPVTPATKPVEPRKVEFPKDYPQAPPTASARANPEFQKGVESDINGVKVIVMSDKRLPLVNWSVTMRRGSQTDPDGKEGTAWLTAEMLRHGVKGMDFEKLTNDLDSKGISITVGDGGDYTRLNGSSTTEYLDHAIERSRQILREPSFPEDEFAKLKEQSLNALQLDQESPGTVASNELTRALYGDSVLGRYSTPASVKTIGLEDVKKFYQTIYRPNDAIVVISGDVTVERGRELAKKLIDGWETGELPKVEYELPKKPTTRRIILVDRPEGAGATVRMAVPAYNLRAPVKFAGAVANQILNSTGIDGRLMRYVRAEKGLCYSVGGSFSPNRQAGKFGGSVDTKTENAAEAVTAMFKVLDDMRDKDVTDREITEARSRVAGGMVMGMQTIGQQAGYRVDGILNGYPIDYYDKYPDRIAEVSKEEVRKVMQEYVDDGSMTIVVVAPAAAVKDKLQKLGKVEVILMPSKRAGATQPVKELLKKAA
jgi:zinc protease